MRFVLPFLVLFLFFEVSSVFALPKYSLKEKKRCYVCHFNKNGGGPLNKEGKYYSQHRSFEGYKAMLAKEKAPPKVIVAKKSETSKKVPEVTQERGGVKPPVEVKKEETLLDRTSLSADLLSSFLVS